MNRSWAAVSGRLTSWPPTPLASFPAIAPTSVSNVPAGHYRLVAWNEQGGQNETPVEITGAAAPAPIALTLDSRNYRASQHMDKTGKPYKAPSSREY